jgi:AraC family transcriptional regulator
MANVAAMHAAVTFIEEHLRGDITVGAVADAVGYSLYHFSRTFNGIVHHTPYDYLMRRRISESALALISSDRLIIDIALDYQFNNPETYTRATRRLFGVPPSELRQAGALPFRSAMPRLTETHLHHRNGTPPLKPRIVTHPTRYLVGLQTVILEKDDTSNQQVRALWTLVRRSIPQGPYCIIVRQPPDWEVGHTLITVGALQPFPKAGAPVPSLPLTITPLAGGRRAQCDHVGPPETLDLTLDYIYHTWLPKAKEQPADAWWLVEYGNDTRKPRTVVVPVG